MYTFKHHLLKNGIFKNSIDYAEYSVRENFKFFLGAIFNHIAMLTFTLKLN